jgi:hypothetical protein
MPQPSAPRPAGGIGHQVYKHSYGQPMAFTPYIVCVVSLLLYRQLVVIVFRHSVTCINVDYVIMSAGNAANLFRGLLLAIPTHTPGALYRGSEDEDRATNAFRIIPLNLDEVVVSLSLNSCQARLVQNAETCRHLHIPHVYVPAVMTTLINVK